MRHPTSPLWPALLLILVAVSPVLGVERLVLTSSTVSNEYLEKRVVDGKLQPQSYVFMVGRYFAGNTRDKSLERVSFQTIAERLALGLRTQDFHPAKSLSQADLLLVVHWGATAGRNRDSVSLGQSLDLLANLGSEAEEFQKQLEEANSRGDVEGAAVARDNLTSLSNQTKSEYQSLLSNQRNPGGEDSAAILGLKAELYKEDESLAAYERRKTLFDMTREECYFVIVTAYEAPTLRSARTLKHVWTLRAGINTAGINFAQALDRMGDVASQYFATRQPGVAFNYPAGRQRKGSVEMGDIVVIGTVEP